MSRRKIRASETELRRYVYSAVGCFAWVATLIRSSHPHPDVTLLSYGGMVGKDLIEAGPRGTAKVWPDERGDEVIRPPGDVVDCLRAGTVT